MQNTEVTPRNLIRYVSML